MTDPDWDLSGTDIHSALIEVVTADRDAVLATVIDVEGSAYRRPGAKMVIEADGTGYGHLTAGCLEEEIRTVATEVLRANQPRVTRYDLMEDDDIWGMGIGCNGVIDVLLEPINASLAPLVEALSAREPIAALTIIEGKSSTGKQLPTGSRAYFQGGSNIFTTDSFPASLLPPLREVSTQLLENNQSSIFALSNEEVEATVFIDGIQPKPRLVVFGSGHDVGPVIDLGKKNGFHVDVVGFRGGIPLESRFPNADSHTITAPAQVGDIFAIDENTYVVIMSHNFVDDRLTLEVLLNTDISYIGLMGPRKRFKEMLDVFESENTSFDEQTLATVYTPVGIDIGGDSPYAIATSIIAEVMAVQHDRNPDHISNRSGPIHDRIDI